MASPPTSATTAAPPIPETQPPEVERRVAELRELGTRSPAQAREQAWSWFEELGSLTGRDRDAGARQLNELFRLGRPASGVEGQTEGILVAPLIFSPVDRALRGITSLWMPWLGKRFDTAAGRGDNVLRGSVRWPAKLLWPLYGTKGLTGDRAAFDFQTRVEPGKDDPDRDVLVIDYSVMDSNPRFLIKQIRDELVEVVPGANLGKILYRRGDDYSLIGYFALKSPTG